MELFEVYIIFICLLLIPYIAALFYFSRGLNLIKKTARSGQTPFISIVVCAHNEEKNLPSCLKLLSAQQYPKDRIEFIIINDRSTDDTENIIRQYTLKDKRFKLISIHNRLPDFAPKKRAIDKAVHKAQGEIILLTDADGRPGSYWAKTMASYFTKDTDMVIGYAPYTVKPAGHFAKRILALEYLSHAAVAAATTGFGYPVTCVGTNMAYRKKLYLETGGFGEFKTFISGDDDLFLTRIRELKKYSIKYAVDRETHVYNNPPQLWSKFIHQRMRYASKGFDYPIKVTIILALYFIFNAAILSGIFTPFINLKIFSVTLLCFILKAFSDFLFMRKAAVTLNDMRNLSVFPFAAVMHIPYVVLFAVLAQFKRFRWADAKAEPAVQKKVVEEIA
jgi:cellulose synthase/poly-beta-1,6-N-acetylglucosamine synthase-like glycosyltransferase